MGKDLKAVGELGKRLQKPAQENLSAPVGNLGKLQGPAIHHVIGPLKKKK
jgi:hypothetical protein